MYKMTLDMYITLLVAGRLTFSYLILIYFFYIYTLGHAQSTDK